MLIYESLIKWWNRIQDFLDVSGDVWMGLFTALILVRIICVLKGSQQLNSSEAAAYGSAVVAFAYSNRGGPKGT